MIHRQKSIVALLLLLSFCSGSVRGASDAEGSSASLRDLLKRAKEAYEQKNYTEFLRNMELAYQLRLTHEFYLYNLAAAYALVGKKADALSLLTEAARMGFVYPKIAQDNDFASLRDDPGFKATLQQFADNAKPVGHSQTAAVAHEKGLVPEGLAYDPETKAFYIGSVYRRKIVRLNADGKAEDFSRAADGLWSVFGMRIDVQRRLLWVCTAAQPQVAEIKKADLGKSGICKYELKTGKLLQKYLLPADENQHVLGDLILDAEGNVYTTDSLTPAVYVLRSGHDTFDKIWTGNPFINPQGLVLGPDSQHLLVADYLRGLFLLDLKTRKIVSVARPAHTCLLGIDGIYAVAGGIVAVQNGLAPNRIVRLRLKSNWREVEQCQVLASNNPLFDEPTLGLMANDHFYFIANSQWGAVDEEGHQASADKLKDVVILGLTL
jgi:hypothetical protein